MNFFIKTFGCKSNKYDSQLILQQLQNCGFTSTEKEYNASIIIVNSCTVTSTADKKVKQYIKKIKLDILDPIVVLVGCIPQAFPNRYDLFQYADIILGNSNKFDIYKYLKKFLISKKQIIDIKNSIKDNDALSMPIENFQGRTRAFLKVQDGCNNYCSYCIIPYARGSVTSKPTALIAQEAFNLVNRSYKEIVITGINLLSFGQDTGTNLCNALQIIESIPGNFRIRLGSLEPELLDNITLEKLSKLKKLCPHFHISLQSGCDETLKRMNRRYSSADYKHVVNKIRSLFNNPSITTDIMVGFPGETDDEFSESLDFVKKIGFSATHVFKFSPRPNTKAFSFSGQVDDHLKSQRAKIMTDIVNKSKLDFLSSQIGKRCKVLIESKHQNILYEGYSENYSKVKLYNNDRNQNLFGQIVEVEIISAKNDFLFANIV